MEKIYLKKSSLVFGVSAIILSAANMIFGINLLIKESNMPAGTESDGMIHASFMILQGIIFIIWGSIYLYNRKYYISWTEKEIELLLPGAKKVEIIQVNEINSVNVRLFEVELSVSGEIRKIDLNSLNDRDLAKAKSFFGKINSNNG
jgi:hypothetical protein